MNFNLTDVKGLRPEDQKKINKLVDVYNQHKARNKIKQKYYEGQITLEDVNLGISMPDEIMNLSVGCSWGAKAVDVLASRSMFDGFVSENGEDVKELKDIMERNQFASQYQRACRDELKLGCTFATLAKADDSCKIRFHSPMTAAALWNGEKGRIDCGFAIIDTAPDEKFKNTWTPSHINFYTDEDIVVMTKDRGGRWSAEYFPHKMGIPLMVPLINDSTNDKPFGRSRLKAPVRDLIDGYIRAVANAQIALEFDTTPQKYMLGLTDEQFDAVTNEKFKNYIGSILASTTNPETGQNPTVGQFSQGSLQPHVEMIRILATQYGAATGLPVTDTGVINDANPTSSDAILAQSQTLVLLAEQLNTSNGEALKLIGQMALAIDKNVTLDGLSDDEKGIVAHFKNPAMPSVSVTADAAIKIAQSREGFADTDVFLEMLGFDQANVRRIKAQEQRGRGQRLLEAEFTDNMVQGGSK